MGRRTRVIYDGAWYHVMNRGAGKKHILKNINDNKQAFLETLSQVHLKYEIEIHAYCIMDNHYHLLVNTPNANISEAMMYLQSVYTKIYNQKINSDGPIFRGRYHSILIESNSYLVQVCRYIHLNPVEAKLKQGLLYDWSSFQYYINRDKQPKWLQTNLILQIFNNGMNNTKNFYNYHTVDDIHEELKIFYTKTAGKTSVILNQHYLDKTVHQVNCRQKFLNHIENEVISFFQVSCSQLRENLIGKPNKPKVIFICITKLIYDYSIKEIANHLNYTSSNAVSKLFTKKKNLICINKIATFKQFNLSVEYLIASFNSLLFLAKQK